MKSSVLWVAGPGGLTGRGIAIWLLHSARPIVGSAYDLGTCFGWIFWENKFCGYFAVHLCRVKSRCGGAKEANGIEVVLFSFVLKTHRKIHMRPDAIEWPQLVMLVFILTISGEKTHKRDRFSGQLPGKTVDPSNINHKFGLFKQNSKWKLSEADY